MNIKAINLNFNVSWWGVLLAILIAVATVAILFLLDKFYLKKQLKVEQEVEGTLTQTPAMSVGKFPLTLICGIVIAVVLIVINAVG